MPTYLEKLQDPQWQKKRLKVLERDNWECQHCKDKLSTLTVHHIWYNSFIDPWEYDDYMLITLCQKCHDEEHASIIIEGDRFLNRKSGLTNYEFSCIVYEFLHRVNSCFCDQPKRHTIKLPKRIAGLRADLQEGFKLDCAKSYQEWRERQTENDMQQAYELQKKAIQDQYLTHEEYEEKIKKLADKFGI